MDEKSFAGTPLEGRIDDVVCTGYCPVEVSGRLDGHEFYFKMRQSIYFAISFEEGVDPVELTSEDYGRWISSKQYPQIVQCKEYPGWAEDDGVIKCLVATVKVYDEQRGK